MMSSINPHTLQETDTRLYEIFPYTIDYNRYLESDVTYGLGVLRGYIPLYQELNLFREADEIVNSIQNDILSTQARTLITIINEVIYIIKNRGINISNIPQLITSESHNQSILFEWIFRNFRIGFSIELNEEESGWYLVSKPDFYNIHAYGNLDIKNEDDTNKIVQWLIDFILVHS